MGGLSGRGSTRGDTSGAPRTHLTAGLTRPSVEAVRGQVGALRRLKQILSEMSGGPTELRP
jgi:hypothetical protein